MITRSGAERACIPLADFPVLIVKKLSNNADLLAVRFSFARASYDRNRPRMGWALIRPMFRSQQQGDIYVCSGLGDDWSGKRGPGSWTLSCPSAIRGSFGCRKDSGARPRL